VRPCGASSPWGPRQAEAALFTQFADIHKLDLTYGAIHGTLRIASSLSRRALRGASERAASIFCSTAPPRDPLVGARGLTPSVADSDRRLLACTGGLSRARRVRGSRSEPPQPPAPGGKGATDRGWDDPDSGSMGAWRSSTSRTRAEARGCASALFQVRVRRRPRGAGGAQPHQDASPPCNRSWLRRAPCRARRPPVPGVGPAVRTRPRGALAALRLRRRCPKERRSSARSPRRPGRAARGRARR
jgi:hypothetical protein